MSDNQLKTYLNEIGQLQNLQSLDLSDNQLKTLPNEIGKLKNLQELYLINNQQSTIIQRKRKDSKASSKVQNLF
nr:leucine-rich repeat domain-containing protein [Leptospira noguchii]